MAASRARSGLRTNVSDQAWADFQTLQTDVARAAFADHWLSLNGEALERTWRMCYELLRVVRDTKLYERPMPDRQQTFGSFDDYFGHYFGRGLEAWVELESTYKFAHNYAPKLLGKRYTAARAAQRLAEIKALEEQDAADPRAGTQGGGDASTVDNIHGERPAGTSRQQALRRLRAERPDLLERVLAGELSPHAAMVDAGFRKPTMTIVADVPSVARVLRARFSPAQLQALIEALLRE